MQNLLSGIIRFIIKLILAAFGLVFAVSLLLAALIAVVFSLLKSLITWQKPVPFVVYSQFRQFRQGARGGWPFAQKSTPHSDVVDVEVREVKDPLTDKRLP
jgi:hypothetical protein